MPSSSLLHGVSGKALLSAGFQTAHSFRPPQVLINPLSMEAFGSEIMGIGSTTNFASGTYPGANRGLGYMFEIADALLVQKLWWVQGTTSADTTDIGVYTEAGSKLVSATTPAGPAGANAITELDCTDTLLSPGRYWCVYAQNGLTGTPMLLNSVALLCRMMGVAEMASAMSAGALVSTFTPGSIGNPGPVFCGIAGRTQVQ